MISIASQLFSLVSITEPDAATIENAIAPRYSHAVVGSTIFDSNKNYRLHWFDDGSMLLHISGEAVPIIIDEFVQLKQAVHQYGRKIDIEQFITDISNMISSHIEHSNYPEKRAIMVIIDACTWKTLEEN